MKTDTLFWIASMGKPIAATALMMLVDEGRARLDDSIQKYLPGFQPTEMVLGADKTRVELEPPRTPITLRDLLSHQSGVPYSSSFETDILDRNPLDVRVQSYALEPLLFEPRTDFSYSDAGINTISRVIEVISGMDYAAFLQRRLFDPLSMKDTTFWPGPTQIERLAKSYVQSADGSGLREVPIAELHYPLSDRKTRFPTAAGGLFSTAADLSRFCQMLLNHGELDGKRYISVKSLEEMTRNQLSAPARASFISWSSHGSKVNLPDGYGLGWYTTPDGAFQHGGAYATSMRVDPKRGIATVWLVQQAGCNSGCVRARDAFEELAKRLYGPH
jgi:CubicO group peptidase (beta-lactamase class C family)